MIVPWTLILSISTILTLGSVSCLRLDVRVPSHIILGGSARLGCHFDLEGSSLYAVKWFKDDHQFFRWNPDKNPSGITFHLPGVNVDLGNSSEFSVVLNHLNFSGSGLYRCEVFEQTVFQIISRSGALTVVKLPESGKPQISGAQHRYGVGDTVNANCTSTGSKPAAKLAWFLNYNPVVRMCLSAIS